MSNWKEVKLGDYFKVKHGYAFSGKGIVKDETSNILVTPGNFKIGGGFKENNSKYFEGEYPQEYVLKENDIVVTMTDLSKETDTLGYSAKIPYSENKTFLHNQRVGLIQFNQNNVNRDYLYWVMRTREYQGHIVGSASGTSIMHTSPSRIEEYNFLIPDDIKEQDSIAETLNSLEDKIILLQNQNQTLEQLAETLFNAWFSEKEFTNLISDLIELQNGYAFKSKDFKETGTHRVLKIKNISGGIVDIETSDFVSSETVSSIDTKFKITTGDVLFAMTGAKIGKMGIIPKTNSDLWLNQRVGLFKEKYNGSRFLAYLHLKSDFGMDYIENAATGSAQPNISGTGIENCEFPEISEQEIIDYSSQLAPLYEKLIFNLGQIQKLESLRDTLLPKLMSGEVRLDING